MESILSPKIVGLSISGRSHRRSGRPCEDWSGWFTSDFIAISVADGAGSAPLASIGSAIAVHTALTSLLQSRQTTGDLTWEVTKTWLTTAVQSASDAIDTEAEHREVPPSHLATTLITTIATRDYVAAAHVGDGALVVRDESGTLFTLCHPSESEYANETRLLGCVDSLRATIVSIANVRWESIAVLTDGLQRVALDMPAANAHVGFFRPLFDYAAGHTDTEIQTAIEDLLQSPRLAARTADDLTLVIAHCP